MGLDNLANPTETAQTLVWQVFVYQLQLKFFRHVLNEAYKRGWFVKELVG